MFILLISIITFATPSKFLRSTSIKPVNFLKFPKASIKTKDFLINKDNTAYAFATLNIKGNEKDFKIPLIYNLEGTDRALAKGSFVFKRTDFEIGTGIWSNTLILKDDVTVNVSLILDLLR